MSHDVSGQSSSPMQYYASIHSNWHSAAMLLGSWPIPKMLNIYWQSCSESMSLHSQPLGHHVANHCISVCLITVWTVQVQDVLQMCLSTMGPTLGTNFCHGFSSPTCKEGLQPLGLQDWRQWDAGYNRWCTYLLRYSSQWGLKHRPMMNNNISRYT